MSNYITIKPCDIANGLGCRVVIFLAGCPHHCHNCHNPETWDKDNGEPFTEDTMNLLRKYLNHDYITGVTISGGDPLYVYNLETTNNIVDMVKNEFPNKDIWIYTGYDFEYDVCYDMNLWNIVKKINVLVDGQYIEKLHDISYPYAGSTNQRLIDIQATIKKSKNYREYIKNLEDINYAYPRHNDQSLKDIQAKIEKTMETVLDIYRGKSLISSDSVVIFDYKKEN